LLDLAPTGPVFTRRSADQPRPHQFPATLRPEAGLSVLDITKYFGEKTGGIRTYLLEKARYVEANLSLRQVLIVPGPEDTLTESGGVRAYRLRGPRIPTEEAYRFLLATRTTHRILDHERPDIVEVGSPFFVPWITRRANRDLKAPMVWFFHTHLPRQSVEDARVPQPAATALTWSYFRRLNRLFRATLVASESLARSWRVKALSGCTSTTRRRPGSLSSLTPGGTVGDSPPLEPPRRSARRVPRPVGTGEAARCGA
jgi:hypothetical protein